MSDLLRRTRIQNRRMNKLLLIIALGFLSLNTACSRLDIAYNWADTFIVAKVDDYFDVSSSQKKELKKSVQQDLAKMKEDVVPVWIENARELEKDVAQGTLNETKVSAFFSVVMTDVEHVTSHFSDTAVNFISTTDPSQIEYFKKSFYKKMKKT